VRAYLRAQVVPAARGETLSLLVPPGQDFCFCSLARRQMSHPLSLCCVESDMWCGRNRIFHQLALASLRNALKTACLCVCVLLGRPATRSRLLIPSVITTAAMLAAWPANPLRCRVKRQSVANVQKRADRFIQASAPFMISVFLVQHAPLTQQISASGTLYSRSEDFKS
jgi:hypothetical protein